MFSAPSLGLFDEGDMTTAGKGHAIRRTSDQARYGAEWDRLFGRATLQADVNAPGAQDQTPGADDETKAGGGGTVRSGNGD